MPPAPDYIAIGLSYVPTLSKRTRDLLTFSLPYMTEISVVIRQ